MQTVLVTRPTILQNSPSDKHIGNNKITETCNPTSAKFSWAVGTWPDYENWIGYPSIECRIFCYRQEYRQTAGNTHSLTQR